MAKNAKRIFIGRERELSILNEFLSARAASFVESASYFRADFQ